MNTLVFTHQYNTSPNPPAGPASRLPVHANGLPGRTFHLSLAGDKIMASGGGTPAIWRCAVAGMARSYGPSNQDHLQNFKHLTRHMKLRYFERALSCGIFGLRRRITAFLISIKYRIISMRFDKLSANGYKNQIFAFVVSLSNHERKYLICNFLNIKTL
jgi:hypothetical protein